MKKDYSLDEMVSDLINSHAPEEKLDDTGKYIRRLYIAEIVKLFNDIQQGNKAEESRVLSLIASAVYSKGITEEFILSDSIESNEILEKILPIYDGLSAISEMLAEESKSWETRAREQQQDICNQRDGSEWDSFESSQQTELLRYLGFALYGEPPEEPSASNKETGYPKKQLDEIEKLCGVIKEKDSHESWKWKWNYISEKVEALVNRHATDKTPSLEQEFARRRFVAEICVSLFHEDDIHAGNIDVSLHTSLASAIYGTTITEDKLFNWQTSVQMLLKMSPAFQELTAIREGYPKKGSTVLSVAFMVLKIEFQKKFHCVREPVFRVPNDSEGTSDVRFVDRNLRVYKGWDQYLDTNKLPKGTYCYPKGGEYSVDAKGQVQIEFGESPAGKPKQMALNACDSAGIVVAVGAGVVGLASLVPVITVAAPVLVSAGIASAVTGVYGVGRGIESIVDRHKHDQEIGLKNTEALKTYISIAGISLGMMAMGATMATAKLAARGMVLGPASRFGVNALQVSALTANGVSIISNGVTLYDRAQDGTLTKLEVFQFSTSLLFFGLSVHSYRSASTIIEETQQARLTDYRANLRSNRHRKVFDRTARSTQRGMGRMEGNAKVIRRINNISSRDDFFAGIARINKHHTKREAHVEFGNEPGTVLINGKSSVDPSSFADLSKADRVQILQASKRLDNGLMRRADFDSLVASKGLETGLTLDSDRVIRETRVCRAVQANSHNEVEVIGFLSLMQDSALIMLDDILKNPKIAVGVFNVASSLVKKLGNAVLPHDINLSLQFTVDFILDVVKQMEEIYQTARKLASRDANFDGAAFDVAFGIIGNRLENFVMLVEQIYSVGAKLARFRQEYAAYMALHGDNRNN